MQPRRSETWQSSQPDMSCSVHHCPALLSDVTSGPERREAPLRFRRCMLTNSFSQGFHLQRLFLISLCGNISEGETCENWHFPALFRTDVLTVMKLLCICASQGCIGHIVRRATFPHLILRVFFQCARGTWACLHYQTRSKEMPENITNTGDDRL